MEVQLLLYEIKEQMVFSRISCLFDSVFLVKRKRNVCCYLLKPYSLFQMGCHNASYCLILPPTSVLQLTACLPGITNKNVFLL